MKLKMSEKGIALLFAVLISSVILAIGFGISGILLQQTKMMGEIGRSVVSFYAADSGIEKVLYDIYKSTPQATSHFDFEGDAFFDVVIKCNKDVPQDDCLFCDGPNCDAQNYCIESIGSYKGIRRAIEIQY